MKAIVVYKSLWGNTAAVARAIAEGIGSGAQALSTAEATADMVAGADLIVAGSPVLAFKLPTEQIRDSLRSKPVDAPVGQTLHPSMRLAGGLADGQCPLGGFRTRVARSFRACHAGDHQSPGGCRLSLNHQAVSIIVTGKYGPLKEGELERARQWGAELGKGWAEHGKNDPRR